MSVSLVVIRVELADHSSSPQGFRYSASKLFYMSPFGRLAGKLINIFTPLECCAVAY